MKDKILNYFNSILSENEPKDADYYRSLGYEVDDDLELPDDDKYSLSDSGFDLLFDIKTILFADIDALINIGENDKALEAYKLIIRESVKLLNKTDDFLIRPFELVNSLKEVIYESQTRVTDIVRDITDDSFHEKVFKWVLKEALRKEYFHDYRFIILADLLADLSTCSTSIRTMAENFSNEPVHDKELAHDFLRLAFCFYSENYARARDVLDANKLEFGIRKYFIELHYFNDLADDALAYAQDFLEHAIREEMQLVRMDSEERIARYPGYPDIYLISFSHWCIRFILDTLIEKGYFEKAIYYVIEGFYSEKEYGRYARETAVELYSVLSRSLSKEMKKELSNKFFNHPEMISISIYTVRDICCIEDIWVPLIEAFKENKRLYNILDVYKQYKNQLIVFPEELTDMFYTVILEYVGKGSASDRKHIIKEGLKELSLIKGSTPHLLRLILNLKLKFSIRKVLMSLLDEFILENKLTDEYEIYELENWEKSAENVVPGKQKKDKIGWNNPEWVENVKEMLNKPQYLQELNRIVDASGDSSQMSLEMKSYLFERYKESVITYVGSSKKEESIKSVRTVEALKRIRNLGNSENHIFELILILQIRHPKKAILFNELDKYLSEDGLTERMEYYRQENGILLTEKYKAKIADVSGSVERRAQKLFWNDENWAESQIRFLSEKRSIFELRKARPSDLSVLQYEHSEQLLKIYRDSILNYALNSKKDEATKSGNICEALREIKAYSGNEDFLISMVVELRTMYPKRVKLNEMLDEI